MEEDKVALDVAVFAGYILLESGAEIFRVEETVKRIANAYGMKGDGAFVLSSGIILAEESKKSGFYSSVKHIPLVGVHLGRITAVNQLSREIEQGMYTPNEAMEQLQAIKISPEKKMAEKIIATGLGSGGFCYLFGGTILDSITTFFIGSCLALFLWQLKNRKKKTSKIVLHITGGMFVTALSILLFSFHLGTNMNSMIIGSIMPLVPGVAFTNAIRDIANEDYLSGTVRMVDAILVAFSIAIGVGTVYTVFSEILGGRIIW